MAIEWAFLILLAVGAGLADLRPWFIVLVMAIGWIFVVLVELLSWRARPRYAVAEGPVEAAPVEMAAAVAPPPPGPEPAPAVLPPLPAEPVGHEPLSPVPSEPPAPSYDFSFTAPTEERTEVFSGVPPAKALDPSDPYAPAPERSRLTEAEQRVVYRLEPLKPRPKRKYGWFGPFLAREGEAQAEETRPAEGETEDRKEK
jgi:hypothetical protein